MTQLCAYFERVVDGGTAVEDTQDFTGFATRVERERELKQVIEGELGHFCGKRRQ